MIFLNFSHPFSPEMVTAIETLAGQKCERVIDLPVQFDVSQPFAPQAQALLEQIPLNPQQLQTQPILVNLPALNFISALLLAGLHGRTGYFPSILRLRPVIDGLLTTYEPAEILNLQAEREAARLHR